jgi:hypothetical protein
MVDTPPVALVLCKPIVPEMCPSSKFSVGAGHYLRPAKSFMQNSQLIESILPEK